MTKGTVLFVAVIGSLSTACGGSPAPTAPAPIPVAVSTPLAVGATLDGITGHTVAAAVTPGDPARVSAAGYLTREQPLAPVVFLWPSSENYVLETVYSGAEYCLVRWASGSTLRFAFTPDLARYDSFLAEMAAEAARWSRLPVIALPAGDPTANVTFAVDPAANVDNNALALAYRNYATGTCKITGGTVVFREARNIDGGQRNNTLLHEIGHILGLYHSPDPNDVMSVDAKRTNDRAFGGQERLALTMMYMHRKAGNGFPDRERVGLTSATPRVDLTVCR